MVQFAKHGFSLNVLTASLLSSWPTGRRTPAPLIRPLPCPRLASRMRKAGIVSRWTTMLVGASAVGLSLIGIVPIVGGARQRSDHRCRTRRVHHLSEPAVRADSRLIRPRSSSGGASTDRRDQRAPAHEDRRGLLLRRPSGRAADPGDPPVGRRKLLLRQSSHQAAQSSREPNGQLR